MMRIPVAALLLSLALASVSEAQSGAADSATAQPGQPQQAQQVQEPLDPRHPDSPVNPRRPAWAILKDIGRDFSRLATPDTAAVLSIGGMAALLAHPIDDDVNPRLGGDGWVEDAFAPGKVLGYGLVQGGVAAAAYAWGRRTNAPRAVHIGVDLARAQILTAGLTYALKTTVRRPRPDETNYSFPSGHASVTFATATVLQRHFGWKGALAYSLSAYVAASRLHDNRHHLSDVIFGAAIGTIAGRTVTRHGRDAWTVEATPVRGGMYVGLAR